MGDGWRVRWRREGEVGVNSMGTSCRVLDKGQGTFWMDREKSTDPQGRRERRR